MTQPTSTDWLAQTAHTHPNAPSLLRPHDDLPKYVTLTYTDLNMQVARLAAQLQHIGVGHADVVGVLMHNHARSAQVVHALARLGAVLVPLNTRLTPEELRYPADFAGCKLILCDRPNEASAITLQTADRPIYTVGSPCAETVLALPQTIHPIEPITSGAIDLDAVQSIVFTSGTTGKPKAAQITFGNLYHSALASTQRIGRQPNDRWLLKLPLYHVGGLSILFRACLDGTSVIFPDTHADQPLTQLITATQPTLISLVPTQLYRLINDGWTPPPSLRMILLGGAAASRELIDMALDRGIPIAPTYGMTEAASQVATLLPDQVHAKRGSVGKPLAGTTIRIIDQHGHDLPPNHPGEIIVTGSTVMRGYLGHPPTNGTHSTGDIGYLDTDGDLWLLNRRSDLIISGGENIYPAEVEAVLRQHPAVAEAVVIGIPHPEWGQQVAAAVQVKPDHTLTADHLIAFARQHLAGYKQPRQIVFVAEFPQTASGKIIRRAVADLFNEG